MAVTLVMIALTASAYRTHVVRREVKGTLVALSPLQELVTETFKLTGAPPASELDLPPLALALHHESIEAVKIEHGRLQIRFGANADESLQGRSLAVSPFESMDGRVAWLCGNRPPDVGLYPLGLFGSALPPPQLVTTVDHRYLPPECR